MLCALHRYDIALYLVGGGAGNLASSGVSVIRSRSRSLVDRLFCFRHVYDLSEVGGLLAGENVSEF